MFGSPKSTFWVRFNPLVVTSSCLKNSAKLELEEIVKYFNGMVANEWSDKCNYLVMDYLSVTVKVICALAAQCHIVTIDYLRSLKEASEKSLSYPDPKQFLPKSSPNFVIKNETFGPTPSRKTLFSGITFYFLKSPQWKKMKMSIELAGGSACFCAPKSVGDLTLVKSNSIVMEAETSEDEWITHVQSVLECNNKRIIADAEIGQAILCCSTEMYCNPNATLIKSFSQLQSQTMAIQTQQNISTHTQDSSILKKPRDTEKKQDSSINVKATESFLPSSDVSESKTSTKKRSRSPNKPETSLVVRVDVNEPSKKKSRLLTESVSDNRNPVISANMESSRPVLAPDSLSQAPFIRPKPILVIEDSDPEDVLSDNEDQSKKNVTETTSDKLKQSNVRSCVIDSQLTEAAPGSEIPMPVCIKKEVVETTYEPKKNLKPFTLELSEDSQLRDRQKKSSNSGACSLPRIIGGNDLVAHNSSTNKELDDWLKEASEIIESPSNFTDVYIKPGYLNTKLTKTNALIKVKQEVKEEAEDLPKACAIVSFTNLVFRKPKPPASHEKTPSKDIPKGFVYYKGALVRNFKNFHKSSNSGACSLPIIIGGNDLVAHNSSTNKELDDWLKEASEKESQGNEENKRIEELFNWGPNKKSYKKR